MVTPTAAAALVLSDRARAIESTRVAKSVGVSLVGVAVEDWVAAVDSWGAVAAVSVATVAAAGVVAVVSELVAVLPLAVECDALACDALACDAVACDAVACEAVLAAAGALTALVARGLRLDVVVGSVAVRICGSAMVAA